MKSKKPERPKVVLDTSVLVAALLSRSGASAEVVGLVLTGKVHGFHTEATVAELGEVLSRPKFGLEKQAAEHFIHLITEASFQVASLDEFTVKRCRDAKDDKFLSLASQTEADYIVSLDMDLLDLKKQGKTQIAEPAAFLRDFRARP